MKKGVTIIEMIVVIGIIAILSATLVPLLGRFAPSIRLSGDSRMIVSALRRAQQFSISTEKRYGIKFYPSQKEYQLFSREYDEDSGEYNDKEIETIKLSDGISFDRIKIDGVEVSGDQELYFDPFGAPKGSDNNHIGMQIILINNQNQSKTINIRKNTGHVKAT